MPYAASLPDQGENAGDQAAEPGKSRAVEERRRAGSCISTCGVFEHMPELRADDAGNGGDCNDSDGIGVDPPAAKISMEDPSSADCGQPEHNAEGADVTPDGDGSGRRGGG